MEMDNKIEQLKLELNKVKEELAEIRAQQEDTRNALDANVIAIYRRIWEKNVAKMMTITSFSTCALIVYMAYLLKTDCTSEILYVCMGLTIFCLGVMIVGTIILFFQMVGDISRFIKNKEWQNWKKRKGDQ